MQVCETAVHLKMFNGQKTSLNSVKLSTQKAKGTQDWAKGHLCNLKSILLYVCTQHDTVFSHYSKPIFVLFCFPHTAPSHSVHIINCLFNKQNDILVYSAIYHMATDCCILFHSIFKRQTSS